MGLSWPDGHTSQPHQGTLPLNVFVKFYDPRVGLISWVTINDRIRTNLPNRTSNSKVLWKATSNTSMNTVTISFLLGRYHLHGARIITRCCCNRPRS